MGNKQERSLTWKYFWQQKWKETGFVIIPLSLLLLYRMYRLLSINEVQEFIIFLKDLIVGLLIVGMIALFSLAILVYFIDWLICNWETAKKRAKKEVRNIKKGSRKK